MSAPPRGVTIDLSPVLHPKNAGLAAALLPQLLACRFEPREAEQVSLRYVEEHALHDLLDPRAFGTGGRLAKDALLWPAPAGPWYLRVTTTDVVARATTLRLDPKALPAVGEALRSLDDVARTKVLADLLGEPFGSAILELGPGSRPGSRPSPGLYRGPHAELMVVSPRACVLIDPIGLSSLPGLASTSLAFPRVDAVLFTHGHGDHFHLPTLLAAARRPEVAVVAPRVAATSLLTRSSFVDQLDACEQRSRAVQGGDVLAFEDIRIEAMPFFGEQPTRDGPGPPANVRNCGATYWIETPDLRIAVLADAGVDPAGDIADAVAAVAKRRGPPDIVTACLRTFPSPFYGGLSLDWLTLEVDRLRDLCRLHHEGRLPPVTLGPAGLARVALACGAKWVAPYAHGVPDARGIISDIGWGEGEASEEAASREVERELRRLRACTRVLRWRVGESAPLDGAHV